MRLSFHRFITNFRTNNLLRQPHFYRIPANGPPVAASWSTRFVIAGIFHQWWSMVCLDPRIDDQATFTPPMLVF